VRASARRLSKAIASSRGQIIRPETRVSEIPEAKSRISRRRGRSKNKQLLRLASRTVTSARIPAIMVAATAARPARQKPKPLST